MKTSHLIVVLCHIMCVSAILNPQRLNAADSGRHTCIHDQEMKEMQVRGASLSDGKIATRADLYSGPIRIVFRDFLDGDQNVCTNVGKVVQIYNTTYTCSLDDVLTADKKNVLKNVYIPAAQEYFSRALSINRTFEGNLILPFARCGCSSSDAPVPADLQTTGVDADLVIFLTAYSTVPRGTTIAFACPCYRDTGKGRPLAGYINVGPNAIKTDELSLAEQLGVIRHELTHVLGFSGGLFADYPNPGFVTAKTIYTNQDGTTRNITKIITPNVLRVAKEHFDCQTVDGVELENDGQSGTAGSHWERRVLYNEYMTGFSSYAPQYSQFTLAILEDSGWYTANYSAADVLDWGHLYGCAFIDDVCSKRTAPYFCTKGTESCTWDGKRKGRCNVRDYDASNPVPAPYRYYGSPLIGGSDVLADYCGFHSYGKSLAGDCTISAYEGQNTENDGYDITNFGEHYCPTCRCMEAYDGLIQGPSCHNFTCFEDKLKVKIGLIWYDCVTDGQKIEVAEGYDGGYFVCPTPANKWCGQVPSVDSWPVFTSVSPKNGREGDSITIIASGFEKFNSTDGFTFSVGNDHGCAKGASSGTITNSTITIECEIIRKPNTLAPRGRDIVDIVITDSQGRTATGFGAFSFSAANVLFSSMNVIFTIVALSFYLMM